MSNGRIRAAMAAAAFVAFGLAAEPPPSGGRVAPPTSFEDLDALLMRAERSQGGAIAAGEALRMRHRIRNHRAMQDLVGQLPPGERPRRILYAASGSHLAPLSLCEADPGAAPYRFLYTEIDASAAAELREGLLFLQERGVLNRLDGPKEEGRKISWTFGMGRHEVSLALLVDPSGFRKEGNRLYPAGALADADLVIQHDWAGDQVENLRLVYEFLLSVESRSRVPLLMIEDLEAHPYPVDLRLFVPVAGTRLPYGHRSSPGTLGHGKSELGTPLYGGGVILGFRNPWWRGRGGPALRGVFDFLLFHEFGIRRLNVLEGGNEPLLAPEILDWYTAYGYRALLGEDVRTRPGIRDGMLEAAVAILPLLSGEIRAHWVRRLDLARVFLELEASAYDVADLLPGAVHRRRPGRGADGFPTARMEDLYGRALLLRGEYEADLRREVVEARRLLAVFEKARGGPGGDRKGKADSPEAWAEVYRALAAAE